MSTNLNYKQVANVTRRTWDVETYEKRAQERAKNEDTQHHYRGKHNDGSNQEGTTAATGGVGSDEVNREEFIPAASGAAGPHMSKRAFLKARTKKVDSLDAKIGSLEIINPEAAATTKSVVGAGPSDGSNKDAAITKSGVGWHCKVCDCFLRDSHTYLDHINGRKHQRNLGYSMRVERSTKDQVESRLAVLAKEKEKSSKKLGTDFDPLDEEGEQEEDYHEIVRAKDEELRRRKEERKRERKERKKKKKEQQNEEELDDDQIDQVTEEGKGNDVADDAGDVESGIDPTLAAMMGFSGFGGANKNR